MSGVEHTMRCYHVYLIRTSILQDLGSKDDCTSSVDHVVDEDYSFPLDISDKEFHAVLGLGFVGVGVDFLDVLAMDKSKVKTQFVGHGRHAVMFRGERIRNSVGHLS